MKLSAPKVVVWWIALVLGIIAILFCVGVLAIPALAVIAKQCFWIMTIGWALLIAATLLKGL